MDLDTEVERERVVKLKTVYAEKMNIIQKSLITSRNSRFKSNKIHFSTEIDTVSSNQLWQTRHTGSTAEGFLYTNTQSIEIRVKEENAARVSDKKLNSVSGETGIKQKRRSERAKSK